MVREIGSEFWLNDINYTDNTRTEIPPWLRKFGNVTLTSSGRGAISLILENINPKVKKVLLPSYLCDSIIIPFEKAGYELIYYDIDQKLGLIDMDKILNHDIGVFFHMGYFGFPTNYTLAKIIPTLKSKSVVIIEDVTHTLFSDYNRLRDNDFIIGSIRKWFGIPSGGFISSKFTINQKLLDPPIDFINLRTTALQQKQQYMGIQDVPLKDKYLLGFSRAEEILDQDCGTYKVDKLSESIIKSTDVKDLKDIRRLNYEFLLQHLIDIRGIEIIFNTVDVNISPLFFPIYIKKYRDRVRSELVKRNIYCPVHWLTPKQLINKLSNETKNVYASILSIPCDQRYSTTDMARIVSAIKEIISKEE